MERFTKEIMLSHIEDFEKLYEQRPIANNQGGMNSSHMLPLYVYLKEIKPKLVIESGIWKGQGTWLIENSCDAKIISIDPSLGVRNYISDKVTYLSTDLTTHNWEEILKEHGVEPSDVLVFLDDHQDFDKRIDFLKQNSLVNIIHEDNYPVLQGDCVSPKTLLDQNSNLSAEQIKHAKENIEIYEEFRPIFKSSVTRWGDAWNEKNYATKDPLFEESDKEKYPLFYDEHKGYTWIANVILKKD